MNYGELTPLRNVAAVVAPVGWEVKDAALGVSDLERGHGRWGPRAFGPCLLRPSSNIRARPCDRSSSTGFRSGSGKLSCSVSVLVVGVLHVNKV